MKKLVMSAFFMLFFSFLLSAQSQFFIKLTDSNRKNCISMSLTESQDIKSPFAQGTVIKVGKKGSPDDNGLGNHVIVQYNMDFKYEGKTVKQEPVVIVFANLKTVQVKKGDTIGENQVLGRTWTEADPDPDFKIFILSSTAQNEFLQYKSDNAMKIDGVYYWNPAFLFR